MTSVYAIENIVNNKFYIGITDNIKDRMVSHFNNARNNNGILKKAIRKYGKECFQHVVLESWENRNDAENAEQFWINFLGTKVPYGYNISSGGKGSASGVIYSSKQKQKKSDRMKRFFIENPDAKARCASYSMLGRKHSEESKKKISINRSGNPSRLGAVLSVETKRKISQSLIGKRKGIPFTEEHKKALSIAACRRYK